MFAVSVLIGALADLVFGPVFWSPDDLPTPSATEMVEAEAREEPSLLGTTPPSVGPGVATSGSAPERPSDEVEAVKEPRPPSSLPSPIADVYEALDARAYRNLFGPVRTYSLVDELTDIVTGSGGESWATSQGLEDAAREAAKRRGDVRLPASRYLAFGIPIGPRHHEVLIGHQSPIDLGTTEQILRYLAMEAEVEPQRVGAGSASHGEGLTVAEAFMRDRIKHRAREQSYLARLMETTIGTVGRFYGQFFAVVRGKDAVEILSLGADPDLDALVSAYIRAPTEVRDEILATRPR